MLRILFVRPSAETQSHPLCGWSFTPDEEKLTRFHAGHELVRFFYQGMNKLPDYFLDALLEYNVTVTLVTGKELLVCKGVRHHQSFHIGFTRKTIYIPEGVIREAINKGWDSWAISEAVIREGWPLMDYLLILEFFRRAQIRLRTHAALGSQTVIDGTNVNDPARQTILHTAQELLESI